MYRQHWLRTWNSCYYGCMEEKDLWTDVFAAIRRIEYIKADLEAAESSRDKEIANLYKNGIPITQIARRVGLSKPKIYKVLEQQGAKNSGES